MAGAARFGWRDLVRVWSSAPAAQRMRRPTDVLLLITVDPAAGGARPRRSGSDERRHGAGVRPRRAALGRRACSGACRTRSWRSGRSSCCVLPLAFRRRRRLSLDLLPRRRGGSGRGRHRGRCCGHRDRTSPWMRSWGCRTPRSTWRSGSPSRRRSSSPPPRTSAARCATGAASSCSSGRSRRWRSAPRGPSVRSRASSSASGPAAVTHLLLGSPQGLLTAEQVDIGLADLGLDADAVVEAEDQLPGEALWQAHLSDGRDAPREGLRPRRLGQPVRRLRVGLPHPPR